MSKALINNKIKIKSISKISEVGFTLVEMAIVITIGGILLAFMGSALTAYMKKSRITTTEFRIEKIKEAMEQYLSVNQHYPCVADRTLGAGVNDFGRQVGGCGSAEPGTDITGSMEATQNQGTANPPLAADQFSVRAVHIGAVPVRTLNLPDEFIADAWGQKFTLAMTSLLAVNKEYKSDLGLVDVVDSLDRTVFGPPAPAPQQTTNLAHYALVSHGQTGAGGFILGTGATPPTPCPTAPSLERENCDNNATFRTTLLTSEANAANFYDDYLYYQGQTEPILLIPRGAVMPFNLATCPDGWTVYAPAEGRFVIGADNGVGAAANDDHQNARMRFALGTFGSPGGVQVPAAESIYPIEFYPERSPPPPASSVSGVVQAATAVEYGEHMSSLDLTSGSGGSSELDEALIPPHIALLYCEKQ